MRPLELARAYAEGELTARERVLIEEDERLRELAYAYVAVIAEPEEEPPPCTTRFEDLILPAKRSRLRPLLAVAALILFAGSAYLLFSPEPPLLLEAIPLRALSKGSGGHSSPEQLAHYDPADGDHPRWLWDIDEAKEYASYFGRPLLVFVDYPGCPYCEEYDRRVFPAAEVRTPLREFVSMRTSWTAELQQEFALDLAKGMPVFLVLDGAGLERARWQGLLSPEAMARRLGQVLTEVRAAGLPLRDWRPLRKAARDEEARAALLAARDLAALEKAARQFADTEYESDFLRVRDYFKSHGSLPRLDSSR